jgi:cytochrome c
MLPSYPRVAVTLVATVAALLAAVPASAQSADAALKARGQRLFLRCASCHDVTGSGIVKNGPPLKGVVGRKVASSPGYSYSPSLSALDFTWNAAHLDAWLQQPTAVAAGTTMAFEGMPSAADRKAVIAYLQSLKP